MNYTETQDMTVNKIKAQARVDVNQRVIKLLSEFDARMVRSGGEHPSNDIGIYLGDVELKDGTVVPLCATVSISVKDPVDRRTMKKVFKAYDIAEDTQRYINYLNGKAEKDAIKKELKEKKIAADKAKREKSED